MNSVKPLLFFLISIHFAVFSQTTVDSSQMRVSVLPIQTINVSDTSTLRILENDFRHFLAETGAFSVLSRDLMQAIFEEQKFQMSEQCMNETCIAEAGKVMGLSEIIAVTITEDGKLFTVSAKLVNVHTSKVIRVGSERRKGEFYSTGKRILRNLASVLAGSPNKDHQLYMSEENRDLSVEIEKQEVKLKRFKLTALGNFTYPIQIIEPDRDEAIQKYYDTSSTTVEWSTPPTKGSFSGSISAAFRIKNRLWLMTSVYGGKSATTKGGAKTSHEIDTTISDDVTSVRMFGTDDYTAETYQNYGYIDLGVGVAVDIITSNRFILGMSLSPKIGFLKYYQTGYYTSFTSSTAFVDGMYLGKINIKNEEIYDSEIQGVTFGADLKLNGDFFLTKRISITPSIGFDWKLAPSLKGETNVQKQTVEVSSIDPDEKMTSENYTENATTVLGDWLGTGEYIRITNPDTKEVDPNGNVIHKQKHYKEFAHILFSIGMTFYF